MTETKFTQYYKKESDYLLNNMLENVFGKPHLTIKIINIGKKYVTLEVGIADSKDFILSFGIVTLEKDGILMIDSPHFNVNLKDWIHFSLNGEV